MGLPAQAVKFCAPPGDHELTKSPFLPAFARLRPEVEFRGDLPELWNLGEDVLDELGVSAGQAGGEEAADPGGLEAGGGSTT